MYSYICFAFWLFLYGIWRDNRNSIAEAIAWELAFITCGNAVFLFGFAVCSFIGMLFMEIACFSMLSAVLYLFGTLRWDYTEKKTSRILKVMLDFIGGASFKNNDRVIRILAVNYACSSDDSVGKFISERKREETLHRVTYRQLRDRSDDPKMANVVSSAFFGYFQVWKAYRDAGLESEWDLILWEFMPRTMAIIYLYTSFPIYLLSRIVTVLYPYFIVGYLSYYGLWKHMNLFELVMLGSYIGLQAMVLVLGISVFRTHHWLWHVVPGIEINANKWDSDMTPFLKRMYSFYDSVQWMPVVTDIVVNEFGTDIGPIIMDYVKAMYDAEMH